MEVSTTKINGLQWFFSGLSKRYFMLVAIMALVGFNSFAQPANDNPCNAITLNPDVVCNYQVFTTAAATATTGAPVPGCGGYNGGDVWFQVTVPAASLGTLKFDTQAGGITDLGMAIYRGTCTNLQLIECDDDDGAGLMSQITLNSLTIGSTLWIRAWEYDNDAPGTFGICVKYAGPPPSYDEPCAAIALPNPTTTCTYTTYTNEGATASTGVPAPGCANYQGGDVWFSVVVPAGGILKFDTQTGEMTNGGMAIYNGPCDNLTLIACDDDASTNGLMPQIISSTLTPGSMVYVRIWAKGNVATTVGSFGLCVSIPPPPPANDEPCNAIPIVAGSTCTYATYTTASATSSTSVVAPTCANFQGGDVWFQVIVPCDGKLVFDTQTGVVTDGGMAIYRGTCNNLQLIECDDDDSPNGLMPRISATSLTPGSTIWVRVWEYGNDNPGTFGLCVTIPPPPPPGSTCFTGAPFCSSNTYTFPNSTNVPSLGGGGIYGCLGSTPNPVWYYMQLQTSGNLTIGIQQTNTAGQIIDVDYALWGPFASLNASCNNLTASNIVSCSYSISGTEVATLNNGIAGQFYILLLTNFNGAAGTITFSQTSGSGSTNCNIICTLTSANSGPVCPGGTFDLTASTVTDATYLWTGPNCFTSTLQNPTGILAPTTPGTYIYTVTATTPTGTSCYSFDTVVVSTPPALGADSTIYTCAGTTRDLSTLYTTTGLTTSWTTYPAGAPVPDSTAVGTSGVYQLIGTNTSGCSDTALVTLVIDTVSATVTPTGIATCTTGGQITVTNAATTAGIGNIFEYNISSTPGLYQPLPVFAPVAGTYTIITRDSLGCTSSTLVTVDSTNNLTLSGIGDTTICLGGSVTLALNTNATSFSWLPTAGLSNPTTQSPVASPIDYTTYIVAATLGTCTSYDTVNVTVDNDLTVEAGGPLFIDAGGNAQVLAVVSGANANIASILWTPAQGLSATNILNPVVTPVINGGVATYQIRVTNSLGCFATDDLLVNVVPNCRNVRNAFTPNGDGNNDLWLVYDDYSCLKNVTVHVFNRYGSKVFESKDYKNSWDGRYSNKTLPDGTYYAVIEFALVTGRTITVRTDLTILR